MFILLFRARHGGKAQRRDRRAGRLVQPDGRDAGELGAAPQRLCGERRPRAEDADDHDLRLCRRHPGRHDPAGAAGEVSLDHLQRDEAPEPPGAQHAGAQPHPERRPRDPAPAELRRGGRPDEDARALRAEDHRAQPERRSDDPGGPDARLRRRGRDQQGHQQPAGERDQVLHAGQRSRRQPLQARGEGLLLHQKPRRYDPAGRARADLRPLPQDGQVPLARPRRLRPGPLYRQDDPQQPRRGHHRDEPGRRHGLRLLADAESKMTAPRRPPRDRIQRPT